MKTSKTVLFIGNFLSGSIGTRFFIEELSLKIENMGWRIKTVSHSSRRVQRLIEMISYILKYRDEYNIAIVDVFSGNAFIWAEITSSLLRLMGKDIILTLRGGSLPFFAAKSPRRMTRLLGCASIVTTPSLFIKNALNTIKDNVCYIPNAIDIINYPFSVKSHVSPKLCWMRAFHRVYNPTLAVKTLSMLIQDYPEIKLTMIGPDKGDGTYQKVIHLARELNVMEYLEIRNSVPKNKVPELLKQHDIFLNTTNYESFGVSVLEAAALGMCIVTTNAGELPLLWTNEQDALLVQTDSDIEMAQAVRRILSDRALSISLSNNARKTAEKFDWTYILPHWETLLESTRHQHT